MKLAGTFVPLLLVTTGAATGETTRLDDLPAPVQTYAGQFSEDCSLAAAGRVVANDMFAEGVLGKPDVNGDGKVDYLTYACMFGCERAPYAFVTPGMPCSLGALLLSEGETYRAINLPGTVNKLVEGPHIRIITTRQRFSGEPDCTNEQGCEYVYELKGGTFRRSGLCPVEGCSGLLRAEESRDGN